MTPPATAPQTIDDYIAAFAPDVQAKLRVIRAEVKALLPEAAERICYGIPTFSMGRNLFHFAAFKGHIGLYPGAAAIAAHAAELTSYKTSKGTIQIPLSQEPPLPLIRKLVGFNLKALAAKPAGKRNK